MTKTLKHCMFILAATALFAACSEEDNDTTDSPSGGGQQGGTYTFAGRKLTKAVVSRDISPGTIWTYDLSYDGDHLTEIKETAWYGTRRVVVSYDGDRPIALNAYKDGSLYSSATYTYSGGRVSRVLYMEPEHDSDSPELDSAWMHDYTYTDGKISKITHTDIDDLQYHRIYGTEPWSDWNESYAIEEYPLTWQGNNISAIYTVTVEYSDKKSPFCPPMGLFGLELDQMLSDNPAGWSYVPILNHGFLGFGWCENLVSKNILGSQIWSWSGTYDGDYPSNLVLTVTEYPGTEDERSEDYTITYTYAD